MRTCPVCSNSTQKPVCENCDWPLNMTDAASVQAAILWAAHMYRKVLRLEAEFGRKHMKPLSEMNVHLLEPTVDLVKPLRAEIKTLANGMKVIAKEQDDHTVEIGKLSERLQKLEKLFQDHQKQATAALQQQSLDNAKIDGQQQELRKAFNQQTKVLKELIKEVNVSTSSPLPPATGSASVIAITKAPASPSISLTASNSDRAALSEEEAIVAEYNRKVNEVPLAWREHFMSVSLDPETFIRLRDGDDNNIVFTRDRKGHYLILPRGGYCYLVPNKQRKIIAQIYTTTKAVYHCDGYNESYREFHLVKPALVAEESTECWRLTRKGIIQFL
jgi:hypothetical protein